MTGPSRAARTVYRCFGCDRISVHADNFTIILGIGLLECHDCRGYRLTQIGA